MPISENETLFQLIGTTYGGDGQSTFQLPDLQGRVPVHQGTGPGVGLTYSMGETAGTETVTLSTQQIPVHNHALMASTDIPTVSSPSGNVTGQAVAKPYRAGAPTVTLNPASVQAAGGSQPHDNMQPFLCVSYIISLFGIFPTQN